MNPLISLVIPVYNVERYLDKCVQSALAQTYDNFEVVLVDDGSTDNSGRMCDEYAEKDNRIIVFHKPNGGLSDARNYGVKHCNAELVSFVDSDDCITNDYLEHLWFLMQKYESDISCAGFMRVSEGDSISVKDNRFTDIKLDAGQALERICCTSVSACVRLYKKHLLLWHEFPVGRLYEDMATVYKLMGECKSVAFSDKEVYIWIQREGSITHSGINEKQLDVFWALDGLYKYMNDKYPAYINAASFRYLSDTIYFLSLVFGRCEEKERKKYFGIAREKVIPHLKAANKCKEATLRYKLAAVCLSAGYFPYKCLNKLRSIQKQLI